MAEATQWIFQQGGMVVLLILGFLFFFRYVVPAFQKIEEKHETTLRAQIAEHRERADAERSAFLGTIEKLASTHEAAVSRVVNSVDKLAERIERRADAADKRDSRWREDHKGEA